MTHGQIVGKKNGFTPVFGGKANNYFNTPMILDPSTEETQRLVRGVHSAIEETPQLCRLLLCKEALGRKGAKQDLLGFQEFMVKVLTADETPMACKLYNCPNPDCQYVKWLNTRNMAGKVPCPQGKIDRNGRTGCGEKRGNWTLAT